MSERVTASVASEDEINEALADASRRAERIPSLEDERTAPVVAVPVAAVPRAVAAGPAEDEAHAVHGAATAAPTPAGEEEEKAKAASGGVGRMLALLWRAAYVALDGTLRVINRPFEWMSPQLRQTVGWGAVATIITSLAAWIVLPLL